MSSQTGLKGEQLSNGNLLPTGIVGLDSILNGGLPSNHVYLPQKLGAARRPYLGGASG